jgi:hypothetical protein
LISPEQGLKRCALLAWRNRISALEDVFAAVHIQLQVYLVADAHVAELGFLEIRVYPNDVC